jgi:hypothetical protein
MSNREEEKVEKSSGRALMRVLRLRNQKGMQSRKTKQEDGLGFSDMEWCTGPPSWPVADCGKIKNRVEQRQNQIRFKSRNAKSIYSSSKNCPNVLRFWTVLAVTLGDHGIVLCNKYILYCSMCPLNTCNIM